MRIAVVEDELVVAQRLQRLVQEILGPRLVFLRLLDSLPEAREYLQQHAIDVLFLDLNLRGRDGFALLGEAVAASFATIVVSAHHEQALRAFELGVTDFVPKPFAKERLELALSRVHGRDVELRQHLRKLAIHRPGGIELVEVDRVRYVQGADDYSALHTEDGKAPLHHKSLSALEQLLPERFVRVHRSFLVDIDRARALRSPGAGRHWLELDDGSEVPVARGRVAALRQRLA